MLVDNKHVAMERMLQLEQLERMIQKKNDLLSKFKDSGESFDDKSQEYFKYSVSVVNFTGMGIGFSLFALCLQYYLTPILNLATLETALSLLGVMVVILFVMIYSSKQTNNLRGVHRSIDSLSGWYLDLYELTNRELSELVENYVRLASDRDHLFFMDDDEFQAIQKKVKKISNL